MDVNSYAFRVEWLDTMAALKRPFRLLFFEKRDGTTEAELFDLKNKKVFLKRIHVPGLSLDKIFLGAKLMIFGRQMTVVDYEDARTRAALEKAQRRCLGLVGAEALSVLGPIWSRIEGSGAKVARSKMVALSSSDAAALFGSPAPGRSVVLELIGEDAAGVWAATVDWAAGELGVPPESLLTTASEDLESLAAEAVFGTSPVTSAPAIAALAATGGGGGAAASGGASARAPPAPSVAGSRFPSARATTATMRECAVAIILPHLVASGAAGAALQQLQAETEAAGLSLTALQSFDLSLVMAEEFYEVYRDVVPEFRDMAAELSSGVCVVLEFSGPDAVNTLRAIVGPRDGDVAKRIRASTVRGTFGVDTVKNAVHSTDLDEDGETESEYFFAVLQSTV